MKTTIWEILNLDNLLIHFYQPHNRNIEIIGNDFLKYSQRHLDCPQATLAQGIEAEILFEERKKIGTDCPTISDPSAEMDAPPNPFNNLNAKDSLSDEEIRRLAHNTRFVKIK